MALCHNKFRLHFHLLCFFTIILLRAGMYHCKKRDSSQTLSSKIAMKKLFEKYGDGKSINLEGLEHLLGSLGLGNIVIDDHRIDAHLNESHFLNLHESHNHELHANGSHDGHSHDHNPHDHDSQDHDSHNHDSHNHDSHNHDSHNQDSHNHDSHNHDSHNHDSHNHDEHDHRRKRDVKLEDTDRINLTKCLTPKEMLQLSTSDVSQSISKSQFLQLSPILLYQLDAHVCSNQLYADICKLDEPMRSKACDHHNALMREGQYQGHYDDRSDSDDFNSAGNLTGESLQSNGIFNVPAEVWGYAVLSCFILSVVGLAAVALVPVMQRSLFNHLLQFLVALAIGSLTGDAFLHLLPHSIKPHTHSDDSYDDIYKENDDHLEDKQAIWLGLVALGGVYFFFMTERLMGIFTTRKRDKASKKKALGFHSHEEHETKVGVKLSTHTDLQMSCEDTLMVVHPSKESINLENVVASSETTVHGMASDAHDELHQNCDPGVRDSWMPSHSDSGHHHSHDVPGSVAAVAWMVIMGDGLHNFSDGLAVGAAFAESLTSGLSTAIAVFCHELPHELGDFAVLLRAGMSVKKALWYNCVSSVLCFMGMIVGIAVGNLSSASQWIFAIIAGMFIYIALVDMLPELTRMSPKVGENPCLHLVLQNAGLLTGAAIMLLIAIYEEKITIPHFEP